MVLRSSSGSVSMRDTFSIIDLSWEFISLSSSVAAKSSASDTPRAFAMRSKVVTEGSGLKNAPIVFLKTIKPTSVSPL